MRGLVHTGGMWHTGNMNIIKDKLITQPEYPGGDGISLADGAEHHVENCGVEADASDNWDEAIGVTWGSSATVVGCFFTGARKLVLCGSGDPDKAAVEEGKTVVFEDCIFSHFGRRAPEVQAGMNVIMRRCVIMDWGGEDVFSVRSFGAWAHSGGSIMAEDCIFIQPRFWRGISVMLQDMVGHIGQAWNDRGIRGILDWKSWVPGVCRGLTASDGGRVTAHRCYRNRWWIRVEGHEGEWMRSSEAKALLDKAKRY